MKRRTGKHALAWLAALLLAGHGNAAEYLPGANHFGAVTTESSDGKTACAALDAAGVALGMAVSIVVLATPQRVLKGIVTARSSAGCTRYFENSESAAFYEIGIRDGRFEPHELGVLALPAVAVTTNGGQVGAELDRRQVRFFECSSSEGIHIGVRSAGAASRVVWHDYLSLGVDVDPTCRKADEAGIAALLRTFRRASPTQPH